jgi:hypothetical protein
MNTEYIPDPNNYCVIRIGNGTKLHIAYNGNDKTTSQYYPHCGRDNCKSRAMKTHHDLKQINCDGCRKWAIHLNLISE